MICCDPVKLNQTSGAGDDKEKAAGMAEKEKAKPKKK